MEAEEVAEEQEADEEQGNHGDKLYPTSAIVTHKRLDDGRCDDDDE